MNAIELALGATMLLAGIAAARAPQDPSASGVRLGASLFEKKLFAHCEGVGEVTDIALGRVDGDDRPCLVLAGTIGFALLDPKSAEVQQLVTFEATMPAPFSDAAVTCRILDVDGDGDFEFAKLAANWVGRTSLHGADGKAIWAYPEAKSNPMEQLAVNATFCEDIDSDGKLDFLLSFNASNEVHRLGHAGNLVWSQEWSGSISSDNAIFLDVDGDGHKDVVYVDGKALVARNALGKKLVETSLPGAGYVNAIHFLRDPADRSKDALVVGSYVRAGPLTGQNFHLVGTDAKTVRGSAKYEDIEHRLDTEPIVFDNAAKLASVKLETLRKQAPVAGFSASSLRVRMNDQTGNLVYEEVLGSPKEKMVRTEGASCLLPASEGQPARILIAYGADVWSYASSR